jgi:hypothetical protein
MTAMNATGIQIKNNIFQGTGLRLVRDQANAFGSTGGIVHSNNLFYRTDGSADVVQTSELSDASAILSTEVSVTHDASYTYFTKSGGTDWTTKLAVNDNVKWSGFTNAEFNNRLFTIQTITADQIKVYNIKGNAAGPTETATVTGEKWVITTLSAAQIQSAWETTAQITNPNFTGGTLPTGFTGTYGINMVPNTNYFSIISGDALNNGATLGSPYNGSINRAGLATPFTRPQGAAYDIGAYEYTPLSVTIEQAAGQPDPTNSATINFTVVFSETVSDFATGDVVLSGTAGATTAIVSGSGTTYNIAVAGMTGSGTVVATVEAGVAHNADNNPNAAGTSVDNTVDYDITPPTLTSITINDSAGYTNDATPTIIIVSGDSPAYAAFSCNGGTDWGSWIDYADSIFSFNITNGATGCNSANGSKTLTARLKDALGNISATAEDSTYYNITGPNLSFIQDVEVGPVASDTITPDWGNATIMGWDYDADGTCSAVFDDYHKTDSDSMDQTDQTNNTFFICLYGEDALGNISTLASANDINIASASPVLANSDGHNKYYKSYKKYKKDFKSSANKATYDRIRKLRKANSTEFLRLKNIYDRYHIAGKKVRDALDLKTQQDCKDYRAYNGYKKYLDYKDKANQ